MRSILGELRRPIFVKFLQTTGHNVSLANPVRSRSDTVKGAKASAALYSLVESANATGREPSAYLRRLFEQLPNAKTVHDFEALLPVGAPKTAVPVAGGHINLAASLSLLPLSSAYVTHRSPRLLQLTRPSQTSDRSC